MTKKPPKAVFCFLESIPVFCYDYELMKIVDLTNISKIYNPGKENELKVLDQIDLSIWDGDFIAIMGASGSGKSTLMNIIGLLDLPTSGSYLFKGEAVSELSQKELARLRSDEIGFVFQNFNLLARTTVLENVRLPTIYNRNKSNDDPNRILSRLGLLDKKSSKPNQLSGGQMQRVAIARSLMNKPSLILADEPTGNLDRKTGLDIMNLFAELNSQGHAIVLVTHDPNIAAFAKRIVHISDGKITKEERQIHINSTRLIFSHESV
jgi:putative ABC transport system ATP-binding protein